MSFDDLQIACANAVLFLAFGCFLVVAARNAISLVQLVIAGWVFATRTKPGRNAV